MNIYDITIEHIKSKTVFRYVQEDSGEIMIVNNTQETIPENTGYYLITGEVKLNDGTRYPAIFGISSDDGGEMFEYHFVSDKALISSGEEDIFRTLNKKKQEVFPFEYHLNVNVENDLHRHAQY